MWLCDESLKVPVTDLELAERLVWMVVQLCFLVNANLNCLHKEGATMIRLLCEATSAATKLGSALLVLQFTGRLHLCLLTYYWTEQHRQPGVHPLTSLDASLPWFDVCVCSSS